VFYLICIQQLKLSWESIKQDVMKEQTIYSEECKRFGRPCYVGFAFLLVTNRTHSHSQHLGGRWIKNRPCRMQEDFDFFFLTLKY
jgi:hypothetical protein